MKDIEYKAICDTSIEEATTGAKRLRGYASVFGNIDSYGDIIVKGAFTKTIRDFEIRNIKLFSSHNMDARELLGTVVILREDNVGLYFEAELSQAASAQDILIKAKEGHLDEVSIGFFIDDYEMIKKDGLVIREIRAIDLIEISLVSRAANPKTKVLEVKNQGINPKKGEVEMDSEKKNDAETSEEKYAKLIANLEAKMDKLTSSLDEPVKKTFELEEPKTKEERSIVDMKDEASALFMRYLQKDIGFREYERQVEEKALSSVIVENGGALIPVRLWDKIVEEKDRLNKLESRVTKVMGQGPLDILDFDFTPVWANHDDGGTIAETSISSILGKSTLDPQDYALLFTIPKKLQRRAMQSVETLLARRAALEFRTLKDNKIMQGSGHKEPLGILTFLDDSSASTNTVAITALANLDYTAMVDMVYLLNEEYREGAIIVAHPKAVAVLRKIQSSSGGPIFQPVPISGDIPATILGYPLIESRAMEDGDTSGEACVMMGDLKQYYMLEEKDFALDVSEHVEFKTNKVALRMVVSFDGMPVDDKAFVRIAIA